jgi:hypothetical protein
MLPISFCNVFFQPFPHDAKPLLDLNFKTYNQPSSAQLIALLLLPESFKNIFLTVIFSSCQAVTGLKVSNS